MSTATEEPNTEATRDEARLEGTSGPRTIAEQRAAEYYALLTALGAVCNSARKTVQRPGSTTADDIVRAAVRELCEQVPMVDATWALVRDKADADSGQYRLLELSLFPSDTSIARPPVTTDAKVIDEPFAKDPGGSVLLSGQEALSLAWEAQPTAAAPPSHLQLALGRTSIGGRAYVLIMAAVYSEDEPARLDGVVASVLEVFGLGTVWGQMARQAAQREWALHAVKVARRSGGRTAVVSACRRALEAWREGAVVPGKAVPELPTGDLDATCADFLDHWRERLAQPRRLGTLRGGRLRERAKALREAVRWPKREVGTGASPWVEVNIDAGPGREQPDGPGETWVRLLPGHTRTVAALARAYLWVEAAISHAGGEPGPDEANWLANGAQALRSLCEREETGLPAALFAPPETPT